MMIAIIGTRERDSIEDYRLVRDIFLRFLESKNLVSSRIIMIISGGADEGGDRFAQMIAKDEGLIMKIYYPEKTRWGIPKCYFKRNDEIARDADALIAVRDPTDIEAGKGGTEYTIKRYKAFHPFGDLITV